MIFSTEAFNLPSKEVFLQDKGKTVSYPGTMHEDDIKFHADVNEYGKSPRLSLMEILANAEPLISDEQWFEAEKKAVGLIKAVPEFLSGAGQALASDVKAAGDFFMTGKVDEADRALSRKRVVDPGLKIANSLLETFVGRIYEPVRAFTGAVVTGRGGDAVADAIKGFVMPSTVEKISSPERVPFTERELEGGVGALIPRAVAGAIEDVLLYGGAIKNIPKMIENYEINSVRNLLRDSTAKIHARTMEVMNMSEAEAWAYMNRPEVKSHLYYVAQKAMKNQKPTLYGGVPVPQNPGEAAKAVGDELLSAAKKPETVAKAVAGEIAQIQPSSGMAQGAIVESGANVKGNSPTDSVKMPGYKTRSFVTSISDEMPVLKVSGQYIPRSTDELAQKARTLIKDDIAVAEKMAMTGIDDASIATGAELLKHYTELAATAKDPSIANALYDKAAELGNNMAERLTEIGRSVQAASILARQTPEGQIRFAAQTISRYNAQVEKDAGVFGVNKKIPELTGTQARFIRDQMTDISTMAEGEQKAIKWKELQDYISDLVPTPLFKKIVTIWKAGLLTGVKTSGLNIFSNASHAFGTEVLKDIPASVVDVIYSLKSGERTVAFTTRGLGVGSKEGFEKGWRFLTTGYDKRNVLGKLDYKRVNFGKSPFAKGLQAYEETIFKILGAEDQVFYYGAKARSIAEQAIVQAKNKKLKGKAASDLIDDLIQNPTDEMIVLAAADAETAVFQNMTLLHKAGAAIQGIPGGEFVLPFSRTPSAVAWQIINYSPIGFVKTIFDSFKSGKFSQRDFSKGMGRAILGLPVLWMGYQLFNDGSMNLDRPKSEKEKELWKAEGRKANSVKIGDKWRSIQSLGPAGNLLIVGGQFAKNFENSGSYTAAMGKTAVGSAKSFSEQTFLKGMNAAVEALTDPERSAEFFFSGLISSTVPTIVADVARATDDKERRVESIPDAVASRIPVIRMSLQPQVDFLGRDKMIKENFFETMFDFTRPTTEIGDPVVKEIRRLMDQDLQISTTLLGNREGYKILTPEQNTELWQRAGGIAFDKVSAYMQMDSYDETPDDVKAKNIDRIIDKAKLFARTEKVLEITSGLNGQELINKLSEAKKDGLLNREVLEQYKRLR